MTRANIIIFGSSGAGKSSVVNMLCNSERAARTSNGTCGCTLKSTSYDCDILGIPARLWDTAGLNEGEGGRVAHTDAVVNLYKLLQNLTDGINLLIFVYRASRLTDAPKLNWHFFRDVVCQGRVPAVIVVTWLESEEVMDHWWHANKSSFDRIGIVPAGFACITAYRGRSLKSGVGRKFDEEYEESQDRLRELVKKKCLEPGRGWSMPPAKWFKTVVEVTWKSKSNGSEPVETSREVETQALRDMIDGLKKVCGISESEAREIIFKDL